MAKQTWNVDRKKGGTFSFNLDAQGNYTLQKDGFGGVTALNLPELQKEKTTTTTQDTKTASDQTKKAFGDVQPFYYDKKGEGGGGQYTSEYEMQKRGDLATDTTGAWDKGQWGPKPETTGAWDKGQWGPQPSKGTPISAVDKARKDAGTFTSKIDDKSTVESGMQFTDPAPTKVDRFGTGQWGPKPSKGMPVDRFGTGQWGPKPSKGMLQKTSPLKKAAQLTNTALKKVNTGLKPLAKAIGFVMNPVGSAIGMAAGAFKETDQHKHDKEYFSKTNGILENGRIAGNPTTNVFAGLNSVSAFGNLSKTAASRISTRNKTAAKYEGKWSKEKLNEWNATTKELDKQRKDHATSQAAAKNAKDLATGGVAPGASGGGTGCFLKGTQVTMFDGSTKPVEQVDLGDEVAVGGNVFAVGKFLNTELYDYKGIKVSGSHMVNEDGIWMRVRDTKHGISLGDDLNTVYVFGSENRRILINDILFTDYFEVSEQDKLVDNSEDFFNNWKDYGNDVDVDNVATLNMNYEI